jgi:hypothetical protein
MMKPLINTLEFIYMIIYFTIALLAGIILFPLSFLFSKPHFEYDGYDK